MSLKEKANILFGVCFHACSDYCNKLQTFAKGDHSDGAVQPGRESRYDEPAHTECRI